ncbi:MAG TPA: GNAT family N-acetyltransferase [Bacilli bacterium]|jgi:ribosomal protein S18 acetylase RimI-like enzyme|nr:GNAT family N-acetyltransferase [Bacilli bacterium]HQM17924.1 GNAT family N-acetyltransferase [Bacilli bacterium]HQO93568.1 GNAT family N-acetyltransferase [Bacilli bacterium]HQQ38685.1 GNAT family N-acetyltransferase [Bacilli bacterium]
MKFKQFTKDQLPALIKLWNENATGENGIFKPWTEELFTNKFLNNPHFKNESLVLLYKENELIGAGQANFTNQNPESPGFITFVVVKKKYQRQGYGTQILEKLEKYLKDNGKTFVRCYFGNPTNLEWYVPGYDKHNHPGAPAVEFNSAYYFLLLSYGYNTNGQLDAFHLELENYELPEYVVNKKKENEKDGYFIDFFDPEKDHGLKELFEDLNSPTWFEEIERQRKLGNLNKLLVVKKDHCALGFTGPIFTEPSGRGYLSGVGIHSKVRARGLGKTMFCELCLRSKENGAKFMTLFTGSDNKARNIYLYAGMRIVKSFAIMRKDFK